MKGVLVLVSLLLLAVLTSGCVESSSPSTPVVTASDREQNLRLDNLTNEVNNLKANVASLQARPTGANQADIDALRARINNLEADISALKAKDAKLEADIAALKGGSSGTTPPPSTPPPSTGTVLVRTYSMTPSMIYGGGNYDIFVEVKNGFAEAKKIVLTVTLTPDPANVKVNSAGTPPTKFSSDSPYVLGTGDKMATTVSAGDCTNLTNLIMGTTNQILIGGNQTLLIPVKFTLTYCSGSAQAIWSPTWSATVIP